MRIPVRTAILTAAACLTAVQPALPQTTAAAPAPAESPGAVVSACHISPIVADLDRSARFYHDVLGMDLMPAPPAGLLPWDTDPGHLDLHGLPGARLRFIQARMPGVRCGIELVEFAGVDRTPVHRRYQDPGAATIILTVRDIDRAFAAVRNAGAHVVTSGGAPIVMSTANRTRAVTVQDPDGHFVELAQVDPPPPTTVPEGSNVIGIRLRLTVADVEQSLAYYQSVLKVQGAVHPFAHNARVMTMTGLPEKGEYQLATLPMPGSTLVFELMGFRGLDSAKAPLPSRVQDPGSFRLQLTMRDIDAALANLKNAGGRVISTGGVPVHMTFGGRPWQLSVVPDPNNLFLIVQQGPPVEPASRFFTTADGVKIHYLTMGSSGSWIVLIHGYTDTAQRMWFTTGIAPALARNHRVVALDNRNHGQSDKPQPGGPGRAQDVVELMDHLKIEKAHIHGYSMGGALTGQLLAMIPGRFITAGFGGSGLQETDPSLRAQAAALDEAAPKPQGADAAALERFRARVSTLLPAGSATPAASSGPPVDVAALTVPILAINGSFDSPYAKTHRLWREARTFQNVILPGKTHLTAVAIGGPMPPEYADAMHRFIDTFDER